LTQYEEKIGLFKALADQSRLEIVDMLSCGELCACMILEKFNITQPTLSHHMKILCDCGIVNKRKEGKWMYYSINNNGCEKTMKLLKNLTTVIETGCPINNGGCNE